MKTLQNIHREDGQEKETRITVGSLQKKARLLILGSLLVGGGIVDGKPLSTQEELSLSKKSNSELLQKNIELETRLSEIQSVFKNLEIQLPEQIKKPENIFDSKGNLTVEGNEFLKEIFPSEITRITQEVENLKSKNAHETAEYVQKITLYLLASLALLTILGGITVISLPFITILKGIKAYNSTLKILERYLPKWLYDFLKKSLDKALQQIGIKKIENIHENWAKVQEIEIGESVKLVEKGGEILVKITKKDSEVILGETDLDGKKMQIGFTSDGYQFYIPWEDSEIKK